MGTEQVKLQAKNKGKETTTVESKLELGGVQEENMVDLVPSNTEAAKYYMTASVTP